LHAHAIRPFMSSAFTPLGDGSSPLGFEALARAIAIS